MISVRQGSRYGTCTMLGELIDETTCRYIYRNRAGTAFVDKRSPSIHIEPCEGCPDHGKEAA
jgi:hypothetical protein